MSYTTFLKRIIPFTVLLIAACATSLSKQDVARDFWTAMAAKDIAKAKTFASAGSLDGVSPNNENDNTIDKVDLRPAKESDGLTVVPTIVTSMENGQEKTLSFDTVMIKENGEWKVDFEKTTNSMLGFSMKDMMEGMGKAMGEAMGNAMKGLGEGIGKGLEGGSAPK